MHIARAECWSESEPSLMQEITHFLRSKLNHKTCHAGSFNKWLAIPQRITRQDFSSIANREKLAFGWW